MNRTKNRIKRILSLILVLTMLFTLSVSVLTGCGDTGEGDESTSGGASSDGETTGAPSGTTGGSETNPPASGPAEFKITVTSAGGIALEDVTLLIYADATLEDLVDYAVTDENGVATVTLDAGGTYSAVIGEAPEGYGFAESYPIVNVDTQISLTSSVITEDTSLSGVSYKLGDIMRDFTVTDSDGNTVTLSKVLEEKKVVLLNFFFTTCSPCINEFPYMNTVYEEYKDEVEVIALNHYPDDTEAMIKSFKENLGLTFPMAKEALGMQTAFNISGYPTSVVIDRYGMICLVEVGGLPYEEPFRKIFDHFTAEDYKQQVFSSLEELMPAEKPNVEMPSSDELSAALGTTGLGILYTPETEGESAEYSWPFVIGEKGGETCIVPSNKNVTGSFAILYATVNLKKGDVLAFDYYSSSEQGADILYVLVDRRDIYQISGEGTGWNACYPFVALEDGEYELSFCYLKDESENVGDDVVYIKDLRVETVADVDVPSFVPRYCATHLRDDGFGYESYVEIFFSEADGYYHVGSVNGPLLLADMMGSSLFTGAEDTLWSLVYNGDAALYEEMVDYFSYASNSTLYGYCPVTTELREFLETVAKNFGIEQTENEWLQICSYYDAYGTSGAQLEDPTKGLWHHSAFKAELGKDNVVTYDRLIMPRGLLYEFVPTKSGVYRIVSDSELAVDGWIFLANDREKPYYEYDGGERLNNDFINCSMAVYLEAGTAYYIDIAFEDVYAMGSFTFEIAYVAETLEIFTVASPGYFTFYESDGIQDVGHLVVGGVEAVLGEDGYYHEKRADGSIGSILYADFYGPTNIFEFTTLQTMAEKTDSFNCLITEDDQWVMDWLEIFEKDGISYTEGFKIEWGDEYDYYMDFFKVEDVVAGKYHGKGKDYSEAILKYVEKMIPASAQHPELQGCVPVDAELAEILQALMDKFSLQAEGSWTKLCYYYQLIGPSAK